MKDEHRFRDFRLLSKHIRRPEARMAVGYINVAALTAEWVTHLHQYHYTASDIAEIESITVDDVRQILAWDEEMT